MTIPQLLYTSEEAAEIIIIGHKVNDPNLRRTPENVKAALNAGPRRRSTQYLGFVLEREAYSAEDVAEMWRAYGSYREEMKNKMPLIAAEFKRKIPRNVGAVLGRLERSFKEIEGEHFTDLIA